MKTKYIKIRLQLIIKRLIDLVTSLLGLIILLPILLLIAIVIRLDSPGKIFYSHRRIGKHERQFNLFKFRSMVFGGDDKEYMEYLHQLIESEKGGQGNGLPYRKMNGDSRVTRVGNFLRKYYLDELPQLWNVLIGEMSLVGPRPHVQIEVDHYTEEQKRRLSVKPGLTGLWQVVGKADCTFSELIQLDLDYIDNWSLKLDFLIMFYTFFLMLKGGEGFWARKVKSIPGGIPINRVLSTPRIISFESTEKNE